MVTELFDDSLDDQVLIYAHALLDLGKAAAVEILTLVAAKAHVASGPDRA